LGCPRWCRCLLNFTRQISRELEKAQNQFALPTDGKSKEQTLAEAGISTSAPQRYEQLAGPREEQAQQAANAAADLERALVSFRLPRVGLIFFVLIFDRGKGPFSRRILLSSSNATGSSCIIM
jgi:hypothetical protein